MRKLTKFLFLLCLLGILATSYLIYTKYSSSAICNINSYFSCSIVNESIYSALFGIPLSILGLIYFILILILVIKSENNKKYLPLVGFLTIPILIYSLYLTYVEIAILKTICLVCEFTKILMFLIVILSFRNI